MGDYRERIISLIYPRRCPVCDQVVPRIGMYICPGCREKLEYIEEPVCFKCGKPVAEGREWCGDCENQAHVFTRGAALCTYPCVRESLYRVKYQGRREYLDFFAEEIVRRMGAQIRLWQADAVTGVPLHKKRQRKRGYNQSALLAEKIGRKMGIPYDENLVLRVKNTVPQKSLTVPERQNNFKKAFIIGQNVVKLNTIIVIDDIYTTGSTIDAVARVLTEAGAARVYFIAIAIGRSPDMPL